MTKTVHMDGLEGWSKRARVRARLMDEQRPFAASTGITFEDAGEMARLLTPSRLSLLQNVRQKPGSIREIAANLGRDQRAVSRDGAALGRYGIVHAEWVTNPGHGRARRVSAPSSLTISARL